jgi:hypothetical protein
MYWSLYVFFNSIINSIVLYCRSDRAYQEIQQTETGVIFLILVIIVGHYCDAIALSQKHAIALSFCQLSQARSLFSISPLDQINSSRSRKIADIIA